MIGPRDRTVPATGPGPGRTAARGGAVTGRSDCREAVRLLFPGVAPGFGVWAVARGRRGEVR